MLERRGKSLRLNPYLGEPLHGRCRGFYRYRKGELRVIYWVDPDDCTIRVARIGYRERIYEELEC